MRKAAMALTILLWIVLLFQSWPSAGLTSPDMAGSVGLFVMLLMIVGLATLASFPLFATGAYLAAALLAIASGSLGYAGLPFYIGLGLLVLTWLAFRHWRARQVATVDVPLLIKPAGKQRKASKRGKSRKAPGRRSGAIWAWGAAAIVVVCLVLYVSQPSLPGVGAIPSGAAQPETTVGADTTPGLGSLEIVAYVDEVYWRVLAVESLGHTLGSSGPFSDFYKTVGEHIRVRVEVENRSDAPRTYTGFKLVDDQENVVARSLTSLWYVPGNERCALRVLRPGKPQTCTEIFRMTKNVVGLRALVNDLKLFGQGVEAQVVLGIPRSVRPSADSQPVEDEPTLIDSLLSIVMPAPIQPYLNSTGNLYADPSMDSAVVGSADAGDTLDLVGQDVSGNWYHLRSGEWIAAFLVDDAPVGLPVVQ